MTRQRFNWSQQKAWANVRNHGVEFELAVSAFADPFAIVTRDQVVDHEWRWRTTAMLDDGRILVVAHTIEDAPDGGELIRIISARFATRSERKVYAEERRRLL